jgi:excisionase family DNA binding protein
VTNFDWICSPNVRIANSLRLLQTKGEFSMDEILTVQEVARYLKLSQTTIWRWCNGGKLPAFKAGHGWRIHRSDLEEIVGQLNKGERNQKDKLG